MYSAMATEASFPDATTIHLISVSTLCCSPVSKNTCEPPMLFACSLVVTISSNLILPASNSSKISNSVIIFVILAGHNFSSPFLFTKIVLDSGSISTAALAVISFSIDEFSTVSFLLFFAKTLLLKINVNIRQTQSMYIIIFFIKNSITTYITL